MIRGSWLLASGLSGVLGRWKLSILLGRVLHSIWVPGRGAHLGLAKWNYLGDSLHCPVVATQPIGSWGTFLSGVGAPMVTPRESCHAGGELGFVSDSFLSYC
ncbi:hypothetical protein TorRG33x02_322030 [Trema orientale]|uniref:Secreted protein n=1 Tax=Trema orientale TaxID=63057 RepID=A0A2P5BGG3_TREOI|nr:hypothetical protein TorRG33x02_322030 [Trema orientale]